MKKQFGGISAISRKRLSLILKTYNEGFTVPEAAHILSMSLTQTKSLLSTWAKYGWLHRIRRGFYIPISIQSTTPVAVPEEPWLIAHKLFAPCYIGGWTAAQHWGFTDQLFNSIYVITTKKVHLREQNLNGVKFKIKTILPKLIFGTQPIWIGKEKVAISDPTKTIIDGLNDPAVFGGIRMVNDIYTAYIKSKELSHKNLLDYAKKMDNSAVYKRLGFLTEKLQFQGATDVTRFCISHLKSGYSQLDPSIKGDQLVTRWNLWIPKPWKTEE